MALIGYARVSTEDQGLEVQLAALKGAGCERIFAEKLSGKSRTGRSELEACLKALAPGDVLVVTKLDRLARSLIDLVTILNGLVERGVGFRCLTQAIDLTTSMGKFIMQVMGAVAEFERDLIVERTREGVARAKAAGKYKGGKQKIASEVIVGHLRTGLRGADLARALGCSEGTAYRYQARHYAELWR